MAAIDDQFAPFERKWLESSPEHAFVRIFLPARVRRVASAFGALVHELSLAAFQVGEPQVAMSKLGWWRQELTDAGSGHARHPITCVLFDDGRVKDSPAALWLALAEAALNCVDLPAAADLRDLLAQLRPWHAAVAAAQRIVLDNGAADPARDADLMSASHLLRSYADPALTTERLALPLNLLARHRLTRETARAQDANGTAFAKDYLAQLGGEIDRALRTAPVDSLPIRVSARLDSRLATQAQRVPDPLAWLAENGRSGRWRCLRVCWREARALARNRGLNP